jgi:hypothetical protein
MRRPTFSSTHLLHAAAALAIAVPFGTPLAAQDPSNTAVIVAPQYVSYQLGSGSTARTISQLGIPFAVIVPFSDRFNIDISSSYANSQVKVPGSATSSITGLTDTQLRGNLTLGDNVAILTLGVNLPSGQYKVPDGQQAAAGQIGNDFLIYPVTSMGNGLAVTGGVGFAQPVGDWNLGVGASFRYSTEFDAYQVQTSILRFTPGNEARLRVGLDRPVGNGSFNVSVTYSKFGKDEASDSTFGTGDRAILQTAYAVPMGATSDLLLSAWDLYRAVGQELGGQTSPAENVGNAGVAVGFQAGGLYIQPNVEERVWTYNGANAGLLTNAGLRFRFAMAGLSINPSATYSFGSLYNPGAPSTGLTGFKASLLIRLH